MSDAAGTTADRGGVWSLPFDRAERGLLTQQAKHDRRAIPAVWMWRLLRPDDGVGSTTVDDTLWQSARRHRRYAAAIPVHLYIDWSPKKKGKAGPVVQTVGTYPVGWTRAEARRVGTLLGTHDVTDGLVADDAPSDFVYVPRPGDIVFARGKHHQVQQMETVWWGATDIVGVWHGTVSLVQDDGSALSALPPLPSLRPPLPTYVPWRA